MVVTHSDILAKRLRALRSHGSVKKYFSEEQGWNSRLDEVQAAIVRVKLRYLDVWSSKRREKAARYDSLLKNVPGFQVPHLASWATHVFHQYTIRLARRDHVQNFLASRAVASTVYYPTPIHLQLIYKSLGHKPGDLPETEMAAAEVLSLPIYPELTEEQIQRVVDTLAEAVRS